MPTVETATDFASDLWDIFRRHNDGYETDLPADRVAARDAAIRRDELARVVKRLRELAGCASAAPYAEAMAARKELLLAADLLEREGAGT